MRLLGAFCAPCNVTIEGANIFYSFISDFNGNYLKRKKKKEANLKNSRYLIDEMMLNRLESP